MPPGVTASALFTETRLAARTETVTLCAAASEADDGAADDPDGLAPGDPPPPPPPPPPPVDGEPSGAGEGDTWTTGLAGTAGADVPGPPGRALELPPGPEGLEGPPPVPGRPEAPGDPDP